MPAILTKNRRSIGSIPLFYLNYDFFYTIQYVGLLFFYYGREWVSSLLEKGWFISSIRPTRIWPVPPGEHPMGEDHSSDSGSGIDSSSSQNPSSSEDEGDEASSSEEEPVPDQEPLPAEAAPHDPELPDQEQEQQQDRINEGLANAQQLLLDLFRAVQEKVYSSIFCNNKIEENVNSFLMEQTEQYHSESYCRNNGISYADNLIFDDDERLRRIEYILRDMNDRGRNSKAYTAFIKGRTKEREPSPSTGA